MKVQRETERPEGASVSYTQLSQPCGLRLKFRRQRVKDKDVGIFLLYGRALHAGIEARAKGRARTDEEAVRVAVATLRSAILQERLPISWDDPWEANRDGGVSADSYGRLCTPEICEWWLRHQVRLYLERFPDQQVVRSEHRIFVPLGQPPGANWRRPWSLECWLDREMRDGSIHDVKSTGSAWGDRDIRKYRIQALIYMGAYSYFYKRQPTYFEFHILPRIREGSIGNYRPAPLVQTVRIEWQADVIQRYVDSVVKPQISVIEANAYVANPGGSLCSERYCSYWAHCGFGSGTNV